MLALQVGAIAGFLVFSVLADRWGRRPMFLIYLLTGAIAVALYLVTTQPFILMLAIFMAGFGVNGILPDLDHSLQKSSETRHRVAS